MRIGYRERLTVPVRWWCILAALIASVWVGYAVATPALVAASVTSAFSLLAAILLVGYGSAQVEVGPEGIRAGRALLPWSACGDAAALTPEEFARLRGPGADARAYLLLRPYVDRAVRVEVRDDRDPTPYWLVATRHPDRLAAALQAHRAAERGD